MTNAFALLIVAAILGGLVVDETGGPLGQHLVSLMAWAIFVALALRNVAAERVALFACLLFATAGELFLALVWGLYDYRLGNLPLFVPPGHVLLYALGLWIAPRLPAPGVAVIGASVAATAIGLAVSGLDQLSLALALLFLLCVRYGRAPKLYCTMFVLALVMELWGTWLGNWAWRPHAPWLDWTTLNPPFAAGAFYCVLDWLVGLVRPTPAAALTAMRTK